MGRGIEKKLTVAGIKSFQKKAAEGSLTYGSKLADGGGLLLVVNRGGSVSWRYRYDLGGRERTYSLGTFPEISLEAARTKLHELRQTVAAGKDPVQEKVIQKQREAAATEDTFANITEQWLKVRRQECCCINPCGHWPPQRYWSAGHSWLPPWLAFSSRVNACLRIRRFSLLA